LSAELEPYKRQAMLISHQPDGAIEFCSHSTVIVLSIIRIEHNHTLKDSYRKDKCLYLLSDKNVKIPGKTSWQS